MRLARHSGVVLSCALWFGSAAARGAPAPFVPDPGHAVNAVLDDRTWIGSGPSYEIRVTMLSDDERRTYLKRLTGLDIDPFASRPDEPSGYLTYHFEITNHGGSAIPFRPQAVWIVTPRSTVEHPIGMETLHGRYRMLGRDLPAAYDRVGRAFLEVGSGLDPHETVAGLLVYRTVGPRISKFYLEVPLTLPTGEWVRLRLPYRRDRPAKQK